MTNLLFGTITGVTDSQVRILLTGRPALPGRARGPRPAAAVRHGRPGRRRRPAASRSGWSAPLFLLLLAVAAAGTSQVTGSLLVFALLVTPAATATG